MRASCTVLALSLLAAAAAAAAEVCTAETCASGSDSDADDLSLLQVLPASDQGQRDEIAKGSEKKVSSTIPYEAVELTEKAKTDHPEACQDTDNGYWDKFGHSCADYAAWMCQQNAQRDQGEHFKSHEMCCICGGGSTEVSCSSDSDCNQGWYCTTTKQCVESRDNYCQNRECGLGDGDCDSDSHCQGSLQCGNRNCWQFHTIHHIDSYAADCCQEALPTCSVEDGTARSSSYPCLCGTATCTGDEFCTASSNKCEACDSSFEGNNFNDRGDSNDISPSTKYTYTTSSGFTVELSGWTHTRNYAKGFLRNVPGTAKAVVKGLNSGSSYAYTVYQYASSHAGLNSLSVNGGATVQTDAKASLTPTASGEAIANSNGEIEFVFEKSSPHVHLSGLAVCALEASLEGEREYVARKVAYTVTGAFERLGVLQDSSKEKIALPRHSCTRHSQCRLSYVGININCEEGPLTFELQVFPEYGESFYVGVDDVASTEWHLTNKNQWTYQKFEVGSVSAGIHKLKIRGREAGITIHRIRFSSNCNAGYFR